MPARVGREETWLVWEKRNPWGPQEPVPAVLSLLAWEAAAALGESALWRGVRGGCPDMHRCHCSGHSAHLVCFTPGPLPSPVRHVHLVEGPLGQQGPRQRPGHGRVVRVAQCFCRDRAGGGDRAAGLAGGGFGLPLTPFIYYCQKASSQPLTPIQLPGL